jgi:hypothetical protein
MVTRERKFWDVHDHDLVINKFGWNPLYRSEPGFHYWLSNTTGSSLPSIPDLTTTLFGMGATGIARFKPGKPSASLGQFLVELRDFPKLLVQMKNILSSARSASDLFQFNIWGRRARRSLRKASNPGSNYLGWEFGVMPMYRDIVAAWELFWSIEDRLKQLRRDNGKSVRRRGTLHSDEVSNTQTYHTHVWTLPTVERATYGTQTYTEVSGAKYWFSGRFRYFIPGLESSPLVRDRAKTALYGLNPSPKLLWEVLPWSWLVDWFVNVGDVVDNISTNAAENLVMDYGYVMGHVYNAISQTDTFNLTNAAGGHEIQTSLTRMNEVKRRIAASPFGFGLSPGSLSQKQWFIITALGLSRSW